MLKARPDPPLVCPGFLAAAVDALAWLKRLATGPILQKSPHPRGCCSPLHIGRISLREGFEETLHLSETPHSSSIVNQA